LAEQAISQPANRSVFSSCLFLASHPPCEAVTTFVNLPCENLHVASQRTITILRLVATGRVAAVVLQKVLAQLNAPILSYLSLLGRETLFILSCNLVLKLWAFNTQKKKKKNKSK
jgi:hypothetical protein